MPDTPEKLDLESKDLIAEKLEQLQQLFPNLVTEGENGKVLDLDQLKNEFSTEVVEGTKERYRLEWPGKKEAIVTANLPTTKTLRPVKEDSVDFDNTENLYIEGDNLEVLKILQESYFGKIKMIYIDPPYNTGKDFVYKDNFSKDAQEELAESGQKDEYNQRLFQNVDTSGRYHSDWLSMMYPRLKLARNLLSTDGVCFFSIGDVELDNLKKLGNEIFGEANFVSCISRVMKKGGQKGVHFSPCIDYILVFAKSIENLSKFREQISQNLIDKVYTKVQETGSLKGEKYRTQGLYQAMLDKRANQRFYIKCPDGSYAIPPGNSFPEKTEEGAKVTPNDEDGVWRWTYDTYEKAFKNDGVEFIKSDKTSLIQPDGSKSQWNIYKKIWLKDRLKDGQLPGNILENFESRHSSAEMKQLKIPFDFPKPKNLIKYLMAIVDFSENDIVLDYFSGSATTADACLELSAETQTPHKYICVQLPEINSEESDEYKQGYKNICEIGKERIRRAGEKIKEETGADIDYGFRVYRLDESNMADVYHTPQDYDQDKLDLFADNVKEDRTAEDLLAQIMLDWGLPLSLPIKEASISGKRVFHVAGNSLLACFDSEIDETFAKEIAKEEPLRIVFKDAGFASDTAKSNVKQLLKQLSPETEMKVI